jgi:hypothetical protein
LNASSFERFKLQKPCSLPQDQLWLSPGGDKKTDREPRPGYILLKNKTTDTVRKDLLQMGYYNKVRRPYKRSHQRHIL